MKNVLVARSHDICPCGRNYRVVEEVGVRSWSKPNLEK